MARTDTQNMERLLRTVHALPRKEYALFTNTIRILYAVFAHTVRSLPQIFLRKKLRSFNIKMTGEQSWMSRDVSRSRDSFLSVLVSLRQCLVSVSDLESLGQ